MWGGFCKWKGISKNKEGQFIYFLFLLNFIPQPNCWPTGSQPYSTTVQPYTDMTFLANNISTGTAAAELPEKAFPSDSMGFITFPSSAVIFTRNLLNSAGQQTA